jgi:predicted  nucleic acid-binding Zn-ribbon protein
MIYNGTAGYTGSKIPYNQFLLGSWQLTEASNNGFVLIHLFGTNDKETPIIAIQGIAEYGNITAARIAASSEITSLSGLPFAEFVAIGSVVVQTADGFTNTPKASIVSVDGLNYVDFRGTQLYTPAGVATNHNLLSGLSGDDHIQYHTDARGDARYYTKQQVDNLIGTGGSAGDISETVYNFSNSQVVAEDITDFAFENTAVRGFTALVTVEIDADTELFEQFSLNGIQKNGSWNMSIESIGDNTNIIFSITSSGQIQYVSQNYVGFVTGKIKFRAITTSF